MPMRVGVPTCLRTNENLLVRLVIFKSLKSKALKSNTINIKHTLASKNITRLNAAR